MHLSTIIALVAAPLVVLAAPGRLPIPNLAASAVHPIPNFAGCRVDNATLSDLPTGQTTIAVPAGQTPVNIAMGVGVQNYTCTNGTFASAGAVATLFDISCLTGTPEFANVQNDFFSLPKVAQGIIEGFAKKTPLLLGYHYFITNPITGSGISPKFAQAANGGSTFTTLSKLGAVHSPAGTSNVDWLELTEVAGTWAKTVFRVDTVAGQPPTTCTGAATTSIPYAAKYWFFN